MSIGALMRGLTVDHLVPPFSPESFETELRALLAQQRPPNGQRDQERRFMWGHDHDFGPFRLSGAMGSRHITLLEAFQKRGLLPQNFRAKRVLDIGVWTGGTSMLLHQMGAYVTAVEEVQYYADALSLMRNAFGLHRLSVCPGSFFAQDHAGYDFVTAFGVLYHVTDPIIFLRKTFEALRPNGTLLLETAASPSVHPILEYRGPTRFIGGSEEAQTRRGWNWFVPSVPALIEMLQDVGFSDVGAQFLGGRAHAWGWRRTHAPMLQAGLSTRQS